MRQAVCGCRRDDARLFCISLLANLTQQHGLHIGVAQLIREQKRQRCFQRSVIEQRGVVKACQQRLAFNETLALVPNLLPQPCRIALTHRYFHP